MITSVIIYKFENPGGGLSFFERRRFYAKRYQLFVFLKDLMKLKQIFFFTAELVVRRLGELRDIFFPRSLIF